MERKKKTVCLLKLNTRGVQATEFGLLSFFATITAIIVAPHLGWATERMFTTGATAVADARDAMFSGNEDDPLDEDDDDSSGDDGSGDDGSGGDDSGDPGPDDPGEDPPGGDEPNDGGRPECGEWVDLDEGFAQGEHVFQARVRGDILGTYQTAKENKSGQLELKNAESLGYQNETLLLLVEFDGTNFFFTDKNRISLFSLDGDTKIVNRALIQDDKRPYSQGDEHIVSHNNKLVIDLNGVSGAGGTQYYDADSFAGNPGRGDNDGQLDFTEFGCLVFPPWYGGSYPS